MRAAFLVVSLLMLALPLAEASPEPPDYATAGHWLSMGEGGGPAVFYLHPTTFSGEPWNAALHEPAAEPGLQDVMATHLGVFAGCCARWAPRYRQAGIRAVADQTGRGQAAYALAYADVLAAFEVFLSRIGPAPFVLAGHSQGSFHLLRLLQEEIAPVAELRDRLIAAYVIGIGVPFASFAPGEALYPLVPCRDRHDTGCVVSWSLFTDDVGARDFARVQAARHRELVARTGEDGFLCVNPISGRADGVPLSAASHPGAWMPGAAGPEAGTTGLVCRDGALVATDALDAPWLETVFAGGNLHLMDYRLTFTAMQRDVEARTSAHPRTHGQAGQSGYLLVTGWYRDAGIQREYTRAVAPVLAAHGYTGAVVGSHGVNMRVLEGDWRPGLSLLLIRFPSEAAAKAFWWSDEYRVLRNFRLEASSLDVLQIDGLPDVVPTMGADSAYLFFLAEVRDRERFVRDYAAQAPAVLHAHGGQFIVRQTREDSELLEGAHLPGSLIVVEFPDTDALRAFWDSEEYRRLSEVRMATGKWSVVEVLPLARRTSAER